MLAGLLLLAQVLEHLIDHRVDIRRDMLGSTAGPSVRIAMQLKTLASPGSTCHRDLHQVLAIRPTTACKNIELLPFNFEILQQKSV